MCILIHVPKGKDVSNKKIKNCWANNPDGGGFVYASAGKLHVYKNLSSVRKYIKAYRDAKAANNVDFLLHFRIGTSGKTDRRNCHPFMVGRNLAFAHNGVLDIQTHKDAKGRNDTRIFRDEVLRKLPENWQYNAGIMNALSLATAGSKMAFISAAGKVSFLHKNKGHVLDGVWYSNETYKSAQVRYVRNYYDYDAPGAYGSSVYGTAYPVERYVDVCEFCGVKLITLEEHYERLCCFCLEAQEAAVD